VVIQNDHVDPTCLNFPDPVSRSGSTIKGNQELRRMQRQASLNRFFRQAISFLKAMRQEGSDIGTKSFQGALQKSDGSHPVHIVVPKENDGLLAIYRLKDSISGILHTTDVEWIAQIA
jgi:hypothetical protein